MLWRLRTLQQLSIGINPSLRCAKVCVDAQLREQEREKEGGYRDGPFVAAVSKLWFHSHFATRGDSSLYHSAICYFVWSRSWPRGRNVCLFPQLPEGEIHSSFCLELVCFCMHSCKCVCVRVHADVHMNMGHLKMGGLFLIYQVSQAIVQAEWTRLNSCDSVWFFTGVKLNNPHGLPVFLTSSATTASSLSICLPVPTYSIGSQ